MKGREFLGGNITNVIAYREGKMRLREKRLELSHLKSISDIWARSLVLLEEEASVVVGEHRRQGLFRVSFC